MVEENCTTPLCEEIRDRSDAVRAIEFAIGIALTVLALAGNALVYVTITRKPELQNATNKVIRSLAAADTLTALISIVFGVPGQLLGQWAFPVSLCALDGFLNLYFYTVSVYHLVLIGLTRYTQVVKPEYHERMLRTRRLYAVLTAVWTIPGLLSLPPFFNLGRYQWSDSFLCCFINDDRRFMLFFTTFGLAIPLITLIYSYTVLFVSVRKHRRKVFPANMSPAYNMEVKVAKMSLIVVAVFTLLWTPSLLTTLLEASDISLPHVWYVVTLDLILTSSAVNPLIYAVMNTNIRKGLAETLLVMLNKLPKAGPSQQLDIKLHVIIR